MILCFGHGCSILCRNPVLLPGEGTETRPATETAYACPSRLLSTSPISKEADRIWTISEELTGVGLSVK